LLAALRAVLAELLPGETVWVYGSLIRPGRFNEYSDIDLALARRPTRGSEFWLQGELEHRLRRRVDVVLLDDTRLHTAIRSDGLSWTP
jgi:predicted nucleotidyltransferase